MKISLAAVLVATAGLVQVSAAPLVVIAIAGAPRTPAPLPVANINALRFGHAAAMVNVPVSEHASPDIIANPIRFNTRPHRPCGGRRPSGLRLKALKVSNAIRKAFGFPVISNETIMIKKVELIPGSNGRPIMAESGTIFTRPGHHSHSHPHPHPHFRGHRYHGRPSFMERLQISLMNLGTWEGRAVAFVLGCGLGVLLRMMWVLFVVGYRAISARRAEEPDYATIVLVEEVEELQVAPPNYEYPVDKKELIEESK